MSLDLRFPQFQRWSLPSWAQAILAGLGGSSAQLGWGGVRRVGSEVERRAEKRTSNTEHPTRLRRWAPPGQASNIEVGRGSGRRTQTRRNAAASKRGAWQHGRDGLDGRDGHTGREKIHPVHAVHEVHFCAARLWRAGRFPRLGKGPGDFSQGLEKNGVWVSNPWKRRA